MKREFLEGLGIEKENIDKIMAENGKDIEAVKANLSTKEQELADAKKLLDDANKEIEGFKDLDVEAIKAKAEDYKAKFEEAQEKAKEELDKVQFNHILENTLKGAKARNVKAVKALLDLEGLKLNEGKVVGLDEQLESIQKENEFLFEVEDTKPNTPTFTRPNDGGKPQAITKEQFNNMGYLDKVSLKKRDPELYDNLKE